MGFLETKGKIMYIDDGLRHEIENIVHYKTCDNILLIMETLCSMQKVIAHFHGVNESVFNEGNTVCKVCDVDVNRNRNTPHEHRDDCEWAKLTKLCKFLEQAILEQKIKEKHGG